MDPARVIDVLLDVIHHPKDDIKATVRRLTARGLAMTVDQVEAVFANYGVKKTVRPRSRRSGY
jgi:molecular chaperone GrpE (heat shock protein)